MKPEISDEAYLNAINYIDKQLKKTKYLRNSDAGKWLFFTALYSDNEIDRSLVTNEQYKHLTELPEYKLARQVLLYGLIKPEVKDPVILFVE